MAKKKEGWQPLLLDVTPKGVKPAGERVEYDAPVRPKAAAAPAPARKVMHEHTPWWDRVKQIEATRADRPRDESWGRAWRGLLNGEGWTLRLTPARQQALETCARGLEVRAGVVEAGVTNGREKPHRVQLRIAPITEAEWARLARQVVDDGAEEMLRRDLDAGIVPLALVDAADQHGRPIVPSRGAQVVATCTCGGARLPCDHVLGTHLSFARRLDDEPLLLLVLRGGPVTELLALVERVRGDAVHQQAGQKRPSEAGDPLALRAGDPPDLHALDSHVVTRAPLASPDGWRAKETFDALVKRLVSAAIGT